LVTTIVLQLRDGEDDLLGGYRLCSIIQKYSDHISVPILMPEEPQEEIGGAAEDRPGSAPPSTGGRRCGPSLRAN
jgi:molecular chaperone HtpG